LNPLHSNHDRETPTKYPSKSKGQTSEKAQGKTLGRNDPYPPSQYRGGDRLSGGTLLSPSAASPGGLSAEWESHKSDQDVNLDKAPKLQTGRKQRLLTPGALNQLPEFTGQSAAELAAICDNLHQFAAILVQAVMAGEINAGTSSQFLHEDLAKIHSGGILEQERIGVAIPSDTTKAAEKSA
jgi:hypothetical protein